MADDRARNQGMKQGTGEGTGQHAPGRNPQDDRSAGQRNDQARGIQHQQPGRRSDFDPARGGDGGRYEKENKDNETRR
ncbi:MAG TPA: hypothetical protein VGJ69_09570 [Pyrinomonadaceae bacterium]